MRAAALTLLLATSSAGADVRTAGIRRAVHELGDARPEDMDAAVEAALEFESHVPGLDAPLLLAIAWAESRFQPTAGRVFCGVMQVRPRDMGLPASRCRAWRASVRAGIEIGVREVQKIMDDIPRVRRDLQRALEYRACGGKAFTRRCHKRGWIRRVEGIAERIRRPPYRLDPDTGEWRRGDRVPTPRCIHDNPWNSCPTCGQQGKETDAVHGLRR